MKWWRKPASLLGVSAIHEAYRESVQQVIERTSGFGSA
jgi:hypothetical protein